MPNNSGPEIIDKISDALRSQISFWNFHLLRYKGMNVTIQRKIENNVDKTKIVLALRIKHINKLINDLKTLNPHKKDIKEELQTYWTTILPEIKEVFKNYKDINNAMKWDYRIEDVTIPEVLEFPFKDVRPPETDVMSRITTMSTATHVKTKTTRPRSVLRSIQNVKSPTKRPGSKS